MGRVSISYATHEDAKSVDDISKKKKNSVDDMTENN